MGQLSRGLQRISRQRPTGHQFPLHVSHDAMRAQALIPSPQRPQNKKLHGAPVSARVHVRARLHAALQRNRMQSGRCLQQKGRLYARSNIIFANASIHT